ncbi:MULTISPECIES: hypothetical protein [unclassified Streptomyces]|uniref:hypothetical protein n=1 Tax=unclassified Streptomyces TaxID=2593676 RepID=UPI002E2E68DA|nr:hypothetical protein [Streptomyces sp. NBC_00228]
MVSPWDDGRGVGPWLRIEGTGPSVEHAGPMAAGRLMTLIQLQVLTIAISEISAASRSSLSA